jgi:hypothetical protein
MKLEPLVTETDSHRGHKITLAWYPDDISDAPWERCDGHGIVSDWMRRDKSPGERILSTDHGAHRFYDFAETMKLARRDGWGLSPDKIAAMERGMGRKATPGEIIAAAVESDFQFLRGWCNDEWHYVGYMVTIENPDGTETAGDSCWGFEGIREYMREVSKDVFSEAKVAIDAAIDAEIESARLAMERNRETLSALRSQIRALCRELKTLCPGTLPQSFPAAAAAVQSRLAEMLRERRDLMARNQELAASL